MHWWGLDHSAENPKSASSGQGHREGLADTWSPAGVGAAAGDIRDCPQPRGAAGAPHEGKGKLTTANAPPPKCSPGKGGRAPARSNPGFTGETGIGVKQETQRKKKPIKNPSVLYFNGCFKSVTTI